MQDGQMMRLRTWLLGAMLLPFAGGAPAFAGAILSPVGVPINKMGFSAGAVNDIINRSGLTDPFVSGTTDYDFYVAQIPIPAHQGLTGTNGWASANPAGGLGTLIFQGNNYMVFDLGQNYSIFGFALWTVNGNDGINGFTLTSAQDSGMTTGVTPLGTFTATKSTTSQAAEQLFVLSGMGEFVELQVNSNFNSNNIGTVAIGEVAFDVQVVPEPAGLAVFGLGLAALTWFRRSRAATLTKAAPIWSPMNG
jgi:hypothetical protein